MQTLTVLAGPTLPADLEDNPAYTDTADCSQFVNHTLNQYAINGFNFGNGIVDDERLGLTGFIYHENNSSVCGNPESAEQYYAYLTNRWLDNTHVKFGGNGHQSNGSSDLDCRFMFCGNSDPCRWNTNGMEPDTAFQYGPEGWTDESVGNAPYLRRGLAIVGPFGFDAGAMQEIDFCISTIFPSFVDSNSRSDHSLLSLVDQMRDNYKDGYYSESFREPDIYTLEETICEGDSYEFYGQQLTEPGTYTHLVRNDVGTIINAAYVLELSVVPVVQVTYAPICPGTAYVDDYFNVTADMTATPGVQIYHTDMTSPNGCPSIMVLYLDVRTDAGVEEHALIKNLKLYPNPTTGFVAMNVEDESLLNGNEVVSVYDLYGQLLQSFLLTNETTSINLSEYADGVYIVKVGHYIGKVVKK